MLYGVREVRVIKRGKRVDLILLGNEDEAGKPGTEVAFTLGENGRSNMVKIRPGESLPVYDSFMGVQNLKTQEITDISVY